MKILKKLRKLGPIGMLRLELSLAQQEIDKLKVDLQAADKANVDKHRELEAMQIKLNEARRCTIPFLNGNGSQINFRPLYVKEYRQDFGLREMDSWSGVRFAIPVHQQAVLTVLAEMVDDPPVIYQIATPRAVGSLPERTQKVHCELCKADKPGSKIDLIKHVKVEHNMGLKEAKDLVEHWEDAA